MSKLDDIRHALDLARQGGYDEVDLLVDGVEFSATLGQTPPPTAAPVVQPATTEAAPPDASASIPAPYVGYFRNAKSPVKAGDRIAKGDVVAGVFALGILNDVEANVSGEVLEVLVSENEPVQFGQPLIKVKKG